MKTYALLTFQLFPGISATLVTDDETALLLTADALKTGETVTVTGITVLEAAQLAPELLADPLFLLDWLEAAQDALLDFIAASESLGTNGSGNYADPEWEQGGGFLAPDNGFHDYAYPRY